MPQTNPASPDDLARRCPEKGMVPLAGITAFEPRHTVRCVGEARFRSQAARDVGCLLDMDADVLDWSCLPLPLRAGDETFVPDLAARRLGGLELICVVPPGNPFPPPWADEAASRRDAVLKVVFACDIDGGRLENSRELMRYAKWRVSLSDRIRILAALDAEGSLTLVECMSAIRNAADPMGAVAALCLRRFVEIDLDSGPLGPETRVIRFRG